MSAGSCLMFGSATFLKMQTMSFHPSLILPVLIQSSPFLKKLLKLSFGPFSDLVPSTAPYAGVPPLYPSQRLSRVCHSFILAFCRVFFCHIIFNVMILTALLRICAYLHPTNLFHVALELAALPSDLRLIEHVLLGWKFEKGKQ